MSVKKEFSTEKEIVKHILSNNEECRNSDKLLFLKRVEISTNYFITNLKEIRNALSNNSREITFKLGKLLSEQEVSLLIDQIIKILKENLEQIPKDLESFPNWLTVRRVRAEIQNTDGVLLPTDPKVAKKRRIREDKIRKYYRNKKGNIKEGNI